MSEDKLYVIYELSCKVWSEDKLFVIYELSCNLLSEDKLYVIYELSCKLWSEHVKKNFMWHLNFESQLEMCLLQTPGCKTTRRRSLRGNRKVLSERNTGPPNSALFSHTTVSSHGHTAPAAHNDVSMASMGTYQDFEVCISLLSSLSLPLIFQIWKTMDVEVWCVSLTVFLGGILSVPIWKSWFFPY